MKRESNDRERIYDIDDEQTTEDLDQDQPEAERSAADAGEDTARRGSAKSASRARQHTGSKRGAQSSRKRAAQRTSRRVTR
jgi:hypothetical protein